MNFDSEKLLHRIMSGPIGQQMIAEECEARDKERAALAADLATLNQTCLAKTQKLTAERDALDQQVAALREQIVPLEHKAMDVAFQLSGEHGSWTDQRNAIWRKLKVNPCPLLVAFKEEVAQRLAISGTLLQFWPNGKSEGGIQMSDSNLADVDKYDQSLILTRDLIDNAICSGVAGKAAEKEIKRLRAMWPAIRVSASKSEVPGV